MITNPEILRETLQRIKHEDIVQFCDAWFSMRGTIKANGFDLTPSARIIQIVGTLKYGFSNDLFFAREKVVYDRGLAYLGMDQIAGRARRAVDREKKEKPAKSEWLLG